MKNILDIIHGNSPVKDKIALFKTQDFKKTHEEVEKELNVSEHEIFNTESYPDKIINKDIGRFDDDGNPITIKATIPVERIGLSIQKLIVEQRLAFMTSIPVDNKIVTSNPESKKDNEAINLLNDILNSNRMYFKNKEVLRRQMSEMECAELWYLVKSKNNKTKYTLKCKILSPSLGDKLMPVFDSYGDMIAFGREYSVDEDGEEVKRFDIYTETKDYKYLKKNGEWKADTYIDSNNKVKKYPIENKIGKIRIVYYKQDEPEWNDVQSMIDRFEKSISKHGDMNDYFGSPILAVTGEVLGFSQKGESGKILELDSDARANYLSLTTPPESIRMEQSNLRELIFSLSSTADISFDKVKGIGNLSAVALTLLFISSSMAAKTKEETFIVGIQRRINIILSAIGNVIKTSFKESIDNISSNPQVTVYTPLDNVSFIEMLGNAVDKGIISIETAVEINPLVSNFIQEKTRLGIT